MPNSRIIVIAKIVEDLPAMAGGLRFSLGAKLMILHKSSSILRTRRRKSTVLIGTMSFLLVSSNLAYAAGPGETQPVPVGHISVLTGRSTQANRRVFHSEAAASYSAGDFSKLSATYNSGSYHF